MKQVQPRYEYTILSNYGHGYEEVCACDDLVEAESILKDYDENEPQYAHKIKKQKYENDSNT